ncbi:MAG: coenzyme F420-0:L-glutamate ligase [Promethearchaeota archaeon]
MELISLKLPLIKKNDDLIQILIKEINNQFGKLKEGDVLVIAEKVIATAQGRVAKLSSVKNISKEAKDLAKKFQMDERYVELILREATQVLGGMTHVILTKVDDFLIANAGIDQSNAGIGNKRIQIERFRNHNRRLKSATVKKRDYWNCYSNCWI